MMETPLLSPQQVADEVRLADWTVGMGRSVLRQMIAVVSQPGILSFAGGLPATNLFPATQYAQALNQVLQEDPRALQYGPPSSALREHIAGMMAQRGIHCTADEVFMTTGAQQGLNVLTRLLLNQGGRVILEETVYTGMQQVVAPYQPEILTVPTDLETGMDVDAVEELLQQCADENNMPAFIYTIPVAHNPLGVSMSMEKRLRLVELARQYRVPILEDDAYGFLIYEEPEDILPPLRSLDAHWVYYAGSFSKILAPALRLGWMIAPKDLIPKLTVIKEAGDLECSALTQRAVATYLSAGHLPAHIGTLHESYIKRRNLMLTALDKYFPKKATWTRPNAGMFIWVEFPSHINCADLLHQAIEEEKVAYIPGYAFATLGAKHSPHTLSCLRLSFSNCPIDQIDDGIQRLAKILK